MFSRRIAVFTIAAAGLSAAASAQSWSWSWGSGERVAGSGGVVSEARDLGVFDGIALSGGLKVVVRQAGQQKVLITADKNLIALIETKVVESSKGRTLEIGPKRGYSLGPTVTPVIAVDMAQLRAVAVAGSGDVRVEAMNTPATDASIAGSGNIVFVDLQSERVGLKVSGSGDVSAAGRSANVVVSIAGSGDVRARELVGEDVKVNIAGSGDAQVHATRKLSVSIAGSGDVAYLGAAELSTSIAGSGRVRKLSN